MRLGLLAVLLGLFARAAWAATPDDFTECKSANDAERMIAGCTRVIEEKLFPTDTLANAHLRRGAAYHHQGDYDKALADYDEAIRLAPNGAVTYFFRGQLYYDENDYGRAVADETRALKLDPMMTSAYNWRGLAYFVQRYNDLAIADFSAAILTNPDYANAYWNRGQAYEAA